MTLKPLTPGRWGDLEAIFKSRGCSVPRGCWCMFYRQSGETPVPRGMTRSQANRAALKALADDDPPPGLIAYEGTTPVGWVSLGPREDFRKLERSHRRKGVAKALLRGAIAYARRRRVRILEAYPVDRSAPSRDDAMWFGTKSMFDAEGFEEVARRRPQRPVMRLGLR